MHKDADAMKKDLMEQNEQEDDLMFKIEDDPRITKVGKFIRRTSIDELPQLWNILKGEMSFVGPRPLIPEEGEIRRMRAAADIYSVLPGLTGWAQVNGRASITDDEKVALDAEYLEKRSFWFDMKILWMTAWQVVVGKNAE